MSDEFKIGDSVVAKPNTKDVDLGGDLGGWQGRIIDINQYEDAEARTILIEWDSITLRNMPESVIIHCEREGLNWGEMGLFEHEVALTTARDTEDDVAEAQAELHDQYEWIGIADTEEMGRHIQAVVSSVNQHDMVAVLEAWDRHLRANLTFPFEAEVDEFQERGPFKAGDKLKVVSMSECDDLYGVLIQAWFKRRKIHFPLCDLEVSDQKLPNHAFVAEYRFWFANR